MATDYINILNAGSGLNTKEIIDSLIESEKTPLENQISTEKSDIEVSISSYSTIKQNFSDLTTNLTQLDGITGLTISNNSSAFDLDMTDSSLATEFDSSISISQLATGHTLVFDGFASELAPVGSGELTLEFGSWTNGSFSANSNMNGGTISIANGSDTLVEVRESINAAALGVTASILKKSDTNYALVLKSQEGQDNAMRTSIGTGKTVSQTTAGVLNSTAEIQSVSGFSSSDLSSLNGRTLFLSDGTNSISVDFSSTPANLAAVVTAITSAEGYSNMDFTVASGTNALTLAYNSSDGDVNLAEVSVLSTGGPDDTGLYYLTNYDTQGSNSYNPAKDLVVTQTTQGVSDTTEEVQSVAGFSSSDLSALGGKTLFFHDGTNSLSINFDSSPADLATLVSSITSETGYSDLDFAVSAGTDSLILTYNSSGGDVELSNVSILPSNSLAVTQTTKGVTGATAEVQSVTGFSDSEIGLLNGETLFLHDGTNSLSVDFSSTPADLNAVVTAITSAEGYSDLNFSVSAGTNALTLTYSASAGDVNLADVGFLSASETVAANDANLTFDGVSITRSSNTITDLISGYTLTLKDTTSSQATFSSVFNTETALLAMSLFVDQLNTINTSLDTLTERGGVGLEAGPLAGDSVANYMKNQLRSMVSSGIDGFADTSIYLAYFGLKTEQDGSFTLDIDTFKDYYEENHDQFAALFNSRVTTGSNLVNGKMLSEEYTPGVYSFILNDSGVGTINDTTLLNSGNSYTATSGAASGLSITTTTGADDTDIYIGRSLIDTISAFTSTVLSNTGDINEKLTSLNDSLTDNANSLSDLNKKMETVRERYNQQFGAMESAVATMKSTENTITNMMEAWKGSMRK